MAGVRSVVADEVDGAVGDPTRGRPRVSRPGTVIAWGGLLYGAAMAWPAGVLLARAIDEGAEPLIVWAVLCVCFGLPVGLALGALAGSRERLVMGRALAGRHLWAGYGLGVALAAHWVVLLAWTPAALVLALVNSYSREEYLRSAVAGLLAWGAVLAGIALIAGTRVAFGRRVLRPADPASSLPPVPHPLLVGAVAGLLVGPAMFVGSAIVAEAGDGAGLALPVALVLGGIGLIAATGIAWSSAAGEVEGARNGRVPVRFTSAFLVYLGVFLAVQWVAFLPLTLIPAWDAAVGQRFIVQILSVIGVSVGVALAGRRLAGLEATPRAG